ncbi:MAG: LUD domain-containing protein [Chitinophagales bacterium]
MPADNTPNLFRSLFPDDDDKKDEKPSFKGKSTAEELDVRFAENFSEVGGKFVYCENSSAFFKMLQSLKTENEWNEFFVCDHEINIFMQDYGFENGQVYKNMEDCDVAISYCYGLVADEGVIMLAPHQATNRRLTDFPNHHVLIAFKNNLISNIEDAISEFKLAFHDKLPSIIELNENFPVYQAHKSHLLNASGTSSVYVFYIDEE